MTTLIVELGDRSYPIYIDQGLLGNTELIRPFIAGQQVMVVSNETVAPLYLETLLQSLAGLQVTTHILPDGEEFKNLEVLDSIFDALLRVPCDRQTTMIALGGGVVGDISGFAAACYQRGIPFIQIPTTLLAQVDSSVGGKTAVNHPRGKNMIGAFYQPRCVIADISTLNTLDDRQLSAGLAEVIKYGLIRDLEFINWLEKNIDRLCQRDPDALAEAIRWSCRSKAEIVAEDELEGGVRALLNLGHTFGHAIEAGMGYGNWLHGEAVATGMLMAADLSHRSGWISRLDVTRIAELLIRAGLPVTPPAELDVERYLKLMMVDKKVHNGHIRLVLLKDIGRAFISDDYDHVLLRETLASRSLF
ncbi:3-dehydroquinate synthase [bacterium BMS3Bbin11]|nr:3-dehydroquinate synthase [bacterium BMS3Abin11]GBE45366.1 3-dehydroquinate synthase [bacterium BMS3Bbin11]GMT39948.1 MAG: 3-dehydroquinate synthase [bacterium]HDH08473.1 3-dehydroquinate synthase [Gammaproteobacteria bacterium]HDH15250.1 3-dehydroquinate synthase [Gammaproteobacteria bacterium]